jgi:hypothetical protein
MLSTSGLADLFAQPKVFAIFHFAPGLLIKKPAIQNWGYGNIENNDK